MIDVVYPYYEAGSGWGGNELRFSLRSLEKHLKEDFRVWLIGDCPVWASYEVRHIPFDRFTLSSGAAFTNNANIAKKILLACQKFNRFLLIADDQYLLKDINLSIFAQPDYMQKLISRPNNTTKWQSRLWDTVDSLKELKLTTFNAECHIPFLITSKYFLALQNIFALSEGKHLWKTAYLNYHYSSLRAKEAPARVTSFAKGKRDFYKKCSNAYFLCHNDKGLTKEMKAFLMLTFNKPSQFEKFSSLSGKIFGIGMPKTGTNSLTQALRNLGYSAKHYPHKPMEMGSTMAATDLPVANNFIELDKKYPNSKFILTVRDDASWKESSSHHFKNNNKSKRAFNHRKLMFGYEKPTVQQLMDGKKRYENKVLDYFKDRPEDLLILNIFAGDGYFELERFLNLPHGEEDDFPHLNKRLEQTA